MQKTQGEKTITIREPRGETSKLTTEEEELKNAFKALDGWEELQEKIGTFYGRGLKWKFNFEFMPMDAPWEPTKTVLFDELYDLSQKYRLKLSDYLKSGLPAGVQILRLNIGTPEKHFIQLPFRLHVEANQTQHETRTGAAPVPTSPKEEITVKDLLPLFLNRGNDNTEIMLEMIRQQREDSANQLQSLKEEMTKDREFYSSSAMGLQDVIDQWQTIKEFEQQVTPAPMSPESKFSKAEEPKKEESEAMQMFKGAMEFLSSRGSAKPTPTQPPISTVEMLQDRRLRIIGMLGAMEPADKVLLALKDMIEFSNTHNLMEYIPELSQHSGNYQAAFVQMLDNFCHDENYKQQLIDIAQANTNNGHRENPDLDRDTVSAEI